MAKVTLLSRRQLRNVVFDRLVASIQDITRSRPKATVEEIEQELREQFEEDFGESSFFNILMELFMQLFPILIQLLLNKSRRELPPVPKTTVIEGQEQPSDSPGEPPPAE